MSKGVTCDTGTPFEHQFTSWLFHFRPCSLLSGPKYLIHWYSYGRTRWSYLALNDKAIWGMGQSIFLTFLLFADLDLKLTWKTMILGRLATIYVKWNKEDLAPWARCHLGSALRDLLQLAFVLHSTSWQDSVSFGIFVSYFGVPCWLWKALGCP